MGIKLFNNNNRNMRGQIFFDLLYLAFILIMLSVLGLVMYKVISDYRQNITGELRAENVAMVKDYEDRLPEVLSGLFLFVLVGVSLIAIVSAFLINSHPIFYALIMVILAVLSYINAIYSNFWYDIATQTELSSYAANLPIITTIFSHFPLVMFVIGLIVGIVMVAKGD